VTALPQRLTAPPAVVIEGFLAPGPCRQVAELADELYEAQELVQNVFQGNAWFTNSANLERLASPAGGSER
jgi:hypothetical protein